ncbi:hypothetical protein NQ774_03410 [Ochrobactrum sp. BD61]
MAATADIGAGATGVAASATAVSAKSARTAETNLNFILFSFSELTRIGISCPQIGRPNRRLVKSLNLTAIYQSRPGIAKQATTKRPAILQGHFSENPDIRNLLNSHAVP